MFLIKLIEKLKMYRSFKNGLQVGENCSFTDAPDFGSEPYLVKLGNHVRISTKVTFLTHDGGTWVFRDLDIYKHVLKFGKIVIGNNCFIGHGVILMPNVILGDNCVVAAGAIVTKSFPDNTVIAGIPAKPLMTTKEYAEKCLKNCPRYDRNNFINNKRDEVVKVYMDNL